MGEKIMTKKISRRVLAKQLGLLTGTASILGPGAAQALVATPKQVEGPFYPPEPHVESDVDLTVLAGHDETAAGEVIYVRGRVTDTRGNALANVRVDIWQANHWGRYTHPEDPNTAPLDPNFQGIGIAHTDENGRYGFKTIKPAAYPLSALGDSGWRARHIHFKVADAAGRKLITQMYFEGDPLLKDDLAFKAAPAEERHLLVTVPEADPETGIAVHRFDISLA
jgi:protocatechuate 3,4-dioxygenase beta subunit